MHEYMAYYVPGIVLYLRCIYVCLEACDYRAFVARMRIGADAGCAGLVLAGMSMGGKNIVVLNTQQAAAWNMWSE